MSLTNFRTLGRSGLVVSPLCLATMTYGPGEWTATDSTARDIFNASRDTGGNFVDTADIYSGSVSEELVNKPAQPKRWRGRSQEHPSCTKCVTKAPWHRLH